MKYKKKKHKLGFYQINPIPTYKELEDFYKNKYFQNNHGSYFEKYTNLELEYNILKSKLSYHIYSHFSKKIRVI